MTNKKVVLLVMVWCCVFESVCPTQILLNALKNTMSHTRCKLHKIGTKIIAHNHKFGDPCGEPPEKHEENALDTHGNHEIVEPSSDNKGHMNEAKQENQQTGTANHPETSTTEKYPSSLDIDVRMGGSDDKKYPTSTRKYATVPSGGGKRIFKAPCKDGQVETIDGCMEEI